MPLLSVIVPVYNVEQYLPQCLESLTNQTFQDMEIICVNDGSTDASLSIMREYAGRDSRITIVDKANTGYGHSMNVGLKKAAGEYIGIVESDDFAEQTMFAKLMDTALFHKADMVKANYYTIKDNEKTFVNNLRDFPYDTAFCPRKEFPKFFYILQSIWSAIYKRDFLESNNILFNETPGASFQDVSFAFKAISCAEKVVLIKDGVLNYRIDNPQSSVYAPDKSHCIYDEIVSIEKFLALRKDLADTCRFIFEPLRFKLHRENYWRAVDKNKFSVLRRCVESYRQTSAENFVKKYWNESDWGKVHEFINNGNEFLWRWLSPREYARTVLWGFLAYILRFNHVVIYGAGQVATEVLPLLINNGITIDAIGVADDKDNPQKLCDISVVTVDKLSFSKDSVVIITAVGAKSQIEVITFLQKNGYNNIFPLTGELRHVLRGFATIMSEEIDFLMKGEGSV